MRLFSIIYRLIPLLVVPVLNAHAIQGSELVQNAHFSQVARLQTFSLENEPTHSTHLVTYYIPSSVDLNASPRAVIFLHGGSYQMARGLEYQTAQIHSYQEDLVHIAESTRSIVVLPGTHIGWNPIIVPLLLEIKRLLQTELHVSGDQLILAGHSMGAMGVGRLASFLTDDFSAFLAVSGVIDPYTYERSYHLAALLNTNFQTSIAYRTKIQMKAHTSYNGEPFPEWYDQAPHAAKLVNELENQYQIKANFTSMFMGGDHQPNVPMITESLMRLSRYQRNDHQKKLLGFFKFDADPLLRRDHYFWMKALEYESSAARAPITTVRFKAEVDDQNNVDIVIGSELDNVTEKYPSAERSLLKKLRVYFPKEIVDISRSVQVVINHQVRWNAIVKPQPLVERDEIAAHYAAFLDFDL